MVRPKSIMAIGIVAAVVLAAWYMIPSASGSTDNTMTVVLTDVSTGKEYIATMILEPMSALSISGGKFYPLTAFDTEVPPIDPEGVYEISFTITTSFSNAAELSSIETETVTVTNVYGCPDTYQFYSENLKTYVTATNAAPFSPTDPMTLVTPPFTTRRYEPDGGLSGDYVTIRGSSLNNSAFKLSVNVYAIDIDGYPTSEILNADIILTVKSPTLIGITVENVGVTT